MNNIIQEKKELEETVKQAIYKFQKNTNLTVDRMIPSYGAYYSDPSDTNEIQRKHSVKPFTFLFR